MHSAQRFFVNYIMNLLEIEKNIFSILIRKNFSPFIVWSIFYIIINPQISFNIVEKYFNESLISNKYTEREISKFFHFKNPPTHWLQTDVTQITKDQYV